MSFAATVLGLGYIGAYLESLGKEGGEKIYLLKQSKKTSRCHLPQVKEAEEPPGREDRVTGWGADPDSSVFGGRQVLIFSAQRPISESAKSIGSLPQKNLHMCLPCSMFYTILRLWKPTHGLCGSRETLSLMSLLLEN